MKFRWRIRQKLAAGLILVAGMTTLLSIGSFYGLYSYRRTNKVFNYQHQQLAVLGYLELAVSGLNFPSGETVSGLDQDLARKEKLERLERIERMLEKYDDGLKHAAAYSFSKAETEKQVAMLQKMRGYLAELRDSVSGKKPTVEVNTPRPIWYLGNERDVIAKLINTLVDLRGVIHQEVTRHVETDRNNYRASLAVVYSTTVLVLVMLVVLVWLGYRAIFHPIRELHRGVTKLAEGKFDFRVRLETGDEMQELGESFNNMADRLQNVYEELNDKVRERSRQLIRSERLASVGFLAAGVAHEINNPLASIAFCGEALEARLKQILPADGENADVVENYLGMIQQEAFRCKAITEKLLDFSRVGEPERVETDLVSLIRNVIEMVQHLGRAVDKQIVFEPEDIVMARVNPQELKQVLLNLVVNALESVDEQGVVRVVTCREEDSVVIRVTDNGCGMTEEVRENLFEPFFTRNRSGKGTGLGLSISHLIISQHGGTLDASSDGPGHGSTFTIHLGEKIRAHAA
ncbi:Sensor protein ZraS [Planctomycetes bacterium Pan216]|uniref:histidine kinase n=1 Tax=Kolteria novifilia TaxID=2527975 RepID=A0A518BD36_9BACT|nr:Sensor protein ZraS [Planctomycetes bacterium Pan216]